MEQYIVSARKYRPSTFRSVVGQQALTHTLKTAIDSKRLAHAYLFCGPRGVGKTSCARIFAKTINCLNPTAEGEACNECESCRAFNEQRSYNIVELDAASNNSVDDIRTLIDQVRIPPQVGTYRVFIIDEVHMLSQAAFNAFLKTLEEPPAHAIFVLATTEKFKILPTILSRCQTFDFSRITIQDIVSQLEYIAGNEGITAETAALNVIAQKADGAMRDALSIFDQVAASSGGNITYQSTIDNLNVLDYSYYFRLVDAFLSCDVTNSLLIYKEVRDHGFDSRFFINGLAQHLRNLMVAANPATRCLLEMGDEIGNQYAAQASKIHPKWFYAALDLCNTCDLNYAESTNKMLAIELTLIKICQLLDNSPSPINPNPNGGKPMQPIAPQQGQPQVQQTQQPQPQQPSVSQQRMMTPTPKIKLVQSFPEEIEKKPNPYSRLRELPKIRGGQQETKTEEHKLVEKQIATQPKRNGSYNYDQVLQAWENYIFNHPRERIITSTMQLARPELIENNNYALTVETPAQLESFEAAKLAILSEIRNEIGNDFFDIAVTVRTKGPAPKIWNPREIVTDMMQKNPEFAQLVKDLQLGLA